MPRPAKPFAALLLPLALLAGCGLTGGESAEAAAARKEAEGRAVGGACRHAGRAIEDCFALNKRVEKSAVFAGWRDMNDYMRENKIDAVAPQGSAPPEVAAKLEEPAREDTAKKPAKAKKQES